MEPGNRSAQFINTLSRRSEVRRHTDDNHRNRNRFIVPITSIWPKFPYLPNLIQTYSHENTIVSRIERSHQNQNFREVTKWFVTRATPTKGGLAAQRPYDSVFTPYLCCSITGQMILHFYWSIVAHGHCNHCRSNVLRHCWTVSCIARPRSRVSDKMLEEITSTLSTR